MKPSKAVLFVALTLELHAAGSGAAISTQLTDAEKSFLDAVAQNNLAEMEFSKVAFAKSSTPAVRDFAQSMLNGRGSSSENLRKVCVEKNYAIAPRLNGPEQETLRKLQSADSVEALEGEYLDAITTDLSAMDASLERISGNSNDSVIARFAADTLIVVKKNEQAAQALAGNK
jgi:putative membrane protein